MPAIRGSSIFVFLALDGLQYIRRRSELFNTTNCGAKLIYLALKIHARQSVITVDTSDSMILNPLMYISQFGFISLYLS